MGPGGHDMNGLCGSVHCVRKIGFGSLGWCVGGIYIRYERKIYGREKLGS